MLCAISQKSMGLALGALALLATIVQAADRPPELPHQQAGQAQTASGLVPYTASIEAVATVDADGKAAATMVATSYISPAKNNAVQHKPVVFLFNGGPIVPSVYLHLGLFAPYQVSFPESTALGPDQSLPWQLKKNPQSLLDVADLVYVDPPETGYSRVAEGREQNAFYSLEADAQQVANFITQWLQRHQREQAPVFLFGESYGTMRAAAVTKELQSSEPELNLSGVLLFGQAVNIIEYSQRPNNALSYVASLPTLALIAAYHGKSAYPNLSPDELFEQAWQYGQTQYLQALVLGNRISPEQLQQTAAELERLTGISADYYVQHRLKITKNEFRTALLPNKILGYYDARYVADYDPKQPVDASSALSSGFQQAHATYLKNELKYASPEGYVLRAPGITSLADWQWGGHSPFSHFNYAAYLDEAFKHNPAFHLFVGSGHYDLTTTSGGAKYLVQQSDWPQQQVMLRNYVGGHMAYTVPQSASALAADTRDFIQRALAAAQTTSSD